MGSWASDSNFSLSSLVNDFTSAANWAELSPPLEIDRTLPMPLVCRLRVHLLAWELGTRQLLTCTKVIGCWSVVFFKCLYFILYTYIASSWDLENPIRWISAVALVYNLLDQVPCYFYLSRSCRRGGRPSKYLMDGQLGWWVDRVIVILAWPLEVLQVLTNSHDFPTPPNAFHQESLH